MIPTEEVTPPLYLWKLTFWMRNAPNAGYATAPIGVEECEKIKNCIKEKSWFAAPMATVNSAIIHYDGAEVFAFQIEKVIV